MSKVKFEKP